MSIKVIIVLAIMLAIFIGILLFAIHLEKKSFNDGICPECGGSLKLFDTDSQGGRGYWCHNCDYHTWVSYNIVDKKHKKK